MVLYAHRRIFQLLEFFYQLTAILFSVSITVSVIFIFQLLVSVTVNCGVIFQLFCHFSYSYS